MDTGGFGVLPEDHEGPVVEQRIPMADDGLGDLAADQVVGQQDRPTPGAFIERKKHVLAVGRTADRLELHSGWVEIEHLRVAGAELVAAREDDPVILGQLLTALADGIVAPRRPGEGIDNEVAVGGLVVGTHPQQHQVAEGREVDVTIGERLVGVLDGLGQHDLTRCGVVLQPELQRSSGWVDEDAVDHVDVGADGRLRGARA